ncbi:hypothetical protein [Wukongibacter baidiensis]
MIKILFGNREYIENIDLEYYEIQSILIMIAYGFLFFFRRGVLAELYAGNSITELAFFTMMMLLFGSITGVIELYINGFLVYLLSKLLGGSSSKLETRVAYSVGKIPIVITYIVTSVIFIVFGVGGRLSSYTDLQTLSEALFVKITVIINLIGQALSLIATSVLIAKVNRITYLKGVISCLMPIILLVISITVFVLGFYV